MTLMAYLIDNPGELRQYSARTNWKPSRPTGLTVLHTTEFPPSWTAAQQAAWLRARTDPGCYHDIADVHGGDMWLIPYEFGAWQDGTGSNGMAVSIAFVLRTTDWRQMTAEQRTRALRAGARCFARQQAWLAANGYPTTPLRLITKAQSDRGEAGFIYHGHRDPTRRTDPGTTPAAPFPFDEWLDHCRAALAGDDLEDDMPLTNEDVDLIWRKPALEGYGVPILILRSLQQQVAGLQAAVSTLAGVAAAGGGSSADELRAVIREEMARVVDVQVSVRDDTPAT